MRTLFNGIVIILVLGTSACGKTELIPTGPDSTVSGWTVTGRAVSNPDNQPIPGASVSGEGLDPTHADEAGLFSIANNNSSNSNYKLVLSADGFAERQTWLRGGSTRQTDDIGLIRNSSLAFYRQFLRNGFDSPNDLRVITKQANFKFYVSTTDENGNDIPQTTINMIVKVIHQSVPQLTDYKFKASVETGREKRTLGVSGLIPVEIITDIDFKNCGSGGLAGLKLKYGLDSNCSCGLSLGMTARTVAHEVGHVMGFFHHSETGVMNPIWNCDQASFVGGFSSKEKEHAAIVRPNGNTDPDNDLPVTSFTFSVSGGASIETKCFQQ